MGIKSIFNRKPRAERIAKLDEASKFLELLNAVQKSDLAYVQDALAAGADASYVIRTHTGSRPMEVAFEKNNVEIFKALLESKGGAKEAVHGFATNVIYFLKHATGSTTIFMPTALYAAISSDKPEIAALLAQHPAIDIEDAGRLSQTGKRQSQSWKEYRPRIKSVLEHAREKGMDELAGILTARMERESAEKAIAREQLRQAQAAALRAQAAELLKQADALTAIDERPQPKPGRGKLNV